MKILFWNIKNFSQTRLDNPYAFTIIDNAITRTQPDIIVIVEVKDKSSTDLPIDGSLPDWTNNACPRGIQGLVSLTATLNQQPNVAWRLVPPLSLGDGGRRERVGVIFNQNDNHGNPQLYYTGPWQLCQEDIDFSFKYQDLLPLGEATISSNFTKVDARIRSYIPSGPGTPYLDVYPNIFRADTYQTNINNGVDRAQFQRTPLVAGQQYTNGFNSLVNSLQATQVPAGAAYNAGRATQLLGGQYVYWCYNTALQRCVIGFPDDRLSLGMWDAQNNSIFPNNPQCDIARYEVAALAKSPLHRAPYLVTFWDSANNRNIKLLALHTSPAQASEALTSLLRVQEIAQLEQNEICIIAGDFNVDVFKDRPVYARLANFDIGLDSMGQGNPDYNRRPNCLTHMISSDLRTPFLTSGAPNRATTDPDVFTLNEPGDSPGGPAPSLGYMGSMAAPCFQDPTYSGCIDNFLYRTNLNNLDIAAYIVNPVSGTIYSSANTAPVGLQYGSELANALLGAGILRTDANAGILAQQFNDVNNLGKINQASDHFPILLVIN